MYRTRFQHDIVAEFLPPARARKKQRVILLCDGMPSIPKKQPTMEFLSAQGFWVFYPRWRGAWESGGTFLQISPEQDLLDTLGELPRGFRETAFGKEFTVVPDETFVIGGSFGGAGAILASLDPRVDRVVANCPVVDWKILDQEREKETSNPSYPAYIRESFGSAYRLSERNWNKLHGGKFFNPAHHAKKLDGTKILMFHAKDDPYIPWQGVRDFANEIGARLRLLERGGHLSTQQTVRKHWREIEGFLNKKSSR
jgi:dipeptidyl aminopeptidase/acylaminoacyl peptidase